MQNTYDIKVATEAAGLLLSLNNRQMSKYILLKMLYLADREAMLKWGSSLTNDKMVSMEDGPVLSDTYDLTKEKEENYWTEFIQTLTPKILLLKKDVPNEELSKDAIALLKGINDKFSKFTYGQMYDYTHDKNNCPEYEEVEKTSKPIDVKYIFKSSGKSDEEIELILKDQAAYDAFKLTLKK